MEDAFIEATLLNARESSLEDGVLRFDILRDVDDTSQFILVEVYKDSIIAPAAHKETQHYHIWRNTVTDMMAEERTRRQFQNIYPTTTVGWEYPQNSPLE